MPRRSCKTFWNEPGSPTFRPFDIALIYTALGERDTAITWMTKAVSERSTWLVYSNGNLGWIL
jgi:hypothetical protein